SPPPCAKATPTRCAPSSRKRPRRGSASVRGRAKRACDSSIALMPLPLEATDLRKSFASVRALDGVSLEVREGEILGLLGPNGAGKTTFVRSVAGRVVPDSGRLTIFGKVVSDPEATAARGWVPQEIALYPLLTPTENLWTFGRYQGLSGPALEAAIRESLEWIGLS